MRVAVLLTGKRPSHRIARFGAGDASIKRFLESSKVANASGIEIEVQGFECYAGRVPTCADLEAFDLAVITGASKSANSDSEWIRDLSRLVTDPGRRAWLLGICFGHQLVGRALGMPIVECDKGWEVGACAVTVFDRTAIDASLLVVLQSHKMCISRPPTGLGNVLPWCGNRHACVQGLLSKSRRIVTAQFHPEYTKEYYRDTADNRPISSRKLKEAVAANLDNVLVADMIIRLVIGADGKRWQKQ